MDDKTSLTERQQMVLDFISQSIQDRGYPPTLREIGQHLGIRSTNGVNDHLKALEKKGFLKREDLKSRALRPLSGTNFHHAGSRDGLTGNTMDIPVLGRVAAGEPILAVEQAGESVRIDRVLVGGAPGRDVFALRIKGSSMIEAGIFDGDFIFVRKQVVANRGDIVVAMIEGEATVKYYYPEGDEVRFKPANHTMSDIIVRKRDLKSVDILGIVVGVFRRLH